MKKPNKYFYEIVDSNKKIHVGTIEEISDSSAIQRFQPSTLVYLEKIYPINKVLIDKQ